MDVRMPNGHIIANVPDGTSKADLLAKLQRNGFDTEKLLQYPTKVTDAPLKFAQSAVGAVRGVSDIFGAANPVSRGLSGVEAGIGEKTSKGQKQLEEQNAATMAAAKGKGLGAETKAFLSTVAHDPLGKTAELLGGIAPTVAAGLLTGGVSAEATLAARLAAAAPMAGVGAAQGIGEAKGVIYERVKQALLEAKVPSKLAEEKAQKAQRVMLALTWTRSLLAEQSELLLASSVYPHLQLRRWGVSSLVKSLRRVWPKRSLEISLS